MRSSLAGLLSLALAVSPVASSCSGTDSLCTLRVAKGDQGILTLTFDATKDAADSLQVVDVTPAGIMPGWLAPYQDKIYSISRTGYPNNGSIDGGVFAWKKTKSASSGFEALESLGSVDSMGAGGVYCDVSPDGRTLSVANIDGATVSIHALNPDGTIGEQTYLFKYNQTVPGPALNGSQVGAMSHEAIFEPSGKYLFVPLRGNDRLLVYEVDGPHSVTMIKNISLPLGTGPRHMAFQQFNATRTFAYLVSDLDSTVRVFALDGVQNEGHGWHRRGRYDARGETKQELSVTLLQTQSALQAGSSRVAPDNIELASEIEFSNDGKFAYVPIRETAMLTKPDNMSVFSVNPLSETNHLTYLGYNSTGTKIPRHFSISPDAYSTYIAVAGQVSQNIVIFERNTQTGFPDRVVGNLSLGSFDITQDKGPWAIIWD